MFARSELIIQKRTKRKELADVDIAPMIGKVELNEEPHRICGTMTVRAQNPGLNPQLLEKAIAKYRPDLQRTLCACGGWRFSTKREIISAE